jgi:hypothetical protein
MESDVLHFLKDPQLFQKIQEDLDFLIVGEKRAKSMAYLIATSRKQPLGSTLAGTFKGGSSAGKSYLTGKVMALMPPDEVDDITSLSAKALFYHGEHTLEHKLIRICERKGCNSADYAVRNLISEPYITARTVVPDKDTGRFCNQYTKVYGPIAYFDTTTSTYTHPENATRLFELYLTDSPEQTKEINKYQARMAGLEYFSMKEREASIISRHQALQKELKSGLITIIPYAELIDFPPDSLRARRDFNKLLSTIKTIAFLHQFQKEVKVHNGQDYIEASPDDYRLAYDVAQDTFLDTLDTLDKRERAILDVIDKNTRDRNEPFDRHDISKWTKINKSHLVQPLLSLEQKEYLLVQNSGGIGQRRLYKYNGDLVSEERQRFGFKGLPTYEELKEKISN